MNDQISIYLPLGNPEDLSDSVQQFENCDLDCKIFMLKDKDIETSSAQIPAGVKTIFADHLFSSETLRKIALLADTKYLLIYLKSGPVQLGAFAIQRMMQVAENTGAGMLYSDYYEIKEGRKLPHPVIDYQTGSLRDDFNFGSLMLFRTSIFNEAISGITENFIYAGLYDLRLKVSQRAEIFHLPEFLYSQIETDTRYSGEKQFDYVDPRNRQVQIEMEKACTNHLKDISAFLTPRFKNVEYSLSKFENEATVIIPVKNRVRTIADAIESVLKQRAAFGFNIIVVDNHSDDGTGDIIRSYSAKDARVIHIVPERTDLGIGGCWNHAVLHPLCGRFAIQLDSDDLYIDENVVSKIVHSFYEQNCAMLIGSYRMVNFDLEEIPPGIIDHKEWTPENGRNNALRINGLGAPRAFYTPVIRAIGFPNVSYGEDYALGISISRYYRIGRIYEPLYLCRRWSENSDASLDVTRLNTFNFYKDKLRTIELKARQQYVLEGQTV